MNNFTLFIALTMLVGCGCPFLWMEAEKISEDVIEIIAEDIVEESQDIRNVEPYIRENDKLHNPEYCIHPKKSF